MDVTGQGEWTLDFPNGMTNSPSADPRLAQILKQGRLTKEEFESWP
jgi:hypothetical protein